jgi:hypothetical protein
MKRNGKKKKYDSERRVIISLSGVGKCDLCDGDTIFFEVETEFLNSFGRSFRIKELTGIYSTFHGA